MAEDDNGQNDNVTFKMPEGFTPPEHLDSDNQFQAMATFELVDDDTLKLVDIEGYQVGPEDTEADTGAAKSAEAQNAMEALQQAGAGGASGAQPGPGIAPNMQGAGSAAGTEANVGGPPGSFAQMMGRRFRQATGRR
jgi:hypothetical protein